jgi:uncharacterized membrane protein
VNPNSNDPKYYQHDTGRIEAFSDGVFAIAITLLVLDIKVPKLTPDQHLAQALLAQWPAYLSYITSFLVTGIIWANHHNMFKHILRADHTLIVLNMLFLMIMALIPFPTALLSAYMQDVNENHVAAIVYGGTFALGSLFFFLIRWYAGSNHLIGQDIETHMWRRTMLRSLVAPAFYLLAIVVSLWNVGVCLVLYALIAVFYVIPFERLPLLKA